MALSPCVEFSTSISGQRCDSSCSLISKHLGAKTIVFVIVTIRLQNSARLVSACLRRPAANSSIPLKKNMPPPNVIVRHLCPRSVPNWAASAITSDHSTFTAADNSSRHRLTIPTSSRVTILHLSPALPPATNPAGGDGMPPRLVSGCPNAIDYSGLSRYSCYDPRISMRRPFSPWIADRAPVAINRRVKTLVCIVTLYIFTVVTAFGPVTQAHRRLFGLRHIAPSQ